MRFSWGQIRLQEDQWRLATGFVSGDSAARACVELNDGTVQPNEYIWFRSFYPVGHYVVFDNHSLAGAPPPVPSQAHPAHLSCVRTGGSDVWLTPPEILDPIRARYGQITYDPCTEQNNPTEATYISYLGTHAGGHTGAYWGDSLLERWPRGLSFVNPPYSRIKQDWAPKILEEAALPGRKVIALLPSRTDREWFRQLYESAQEVYFWPGRIKFLRPDGTRHAQAPFPSVLFSFNCALPEFHTPETAGILIL